MSSSAKLEHTPVLNAVNGEDDDSINSVHTQLDPDTDPRPLQSAPLPSLVVISECNNCGHPAAYLCDHCQTTAYCSRACQLAQWPHHQQICQVEQVDIGNLNQNGHVRHGSITARLLRTLFQVLVVVMIFAGSTATRQFTRFSNGDNKTGSALENHTRTATFNTR